MGKAFGDLLGTDLGVITHSFVQTQGRKTGVLPLQVDLFQHFLAFVVQGCGLDVGLCIGFQPGVDGGGLGTADRAFSCKGTGFIHAADDPGGINHRHGLLVFQGDALPVADLGRSAFQLFLRRQGNSQIFQDVLQDHRHMIAGNGGGQIHFRETFIQAVVLGHLIVGSIPGAIPGTSRLTGIVAAHQNGDELGGGQGGLGLKEPVSVLVCAGALQNALLGGLLDVLIGPVAGGHIVKCSGGRLDGGGRTQGQNQQGCQLSFHKILPLSVSIPFFFFREKGPSTV